MPCTRPLQYVGAVCEGMGTMLGESGGTVLPRRKLPFEEGITLAFSVQLPALLNNHPLEDVEPGETTLGGGF